MKDAPAVGQRDAWVDYAKAIGILLVVYGHVARGVFNAGIPMDESLYRLVDSIIYSFHMPLFFFLSGIFFLQSLTRRGRGALALSKVDTILYPYILWSLIQGLVEVWLSRYTNGSTTLTEVLSLWDPRAQFWFLYALFMILMTAILVYRNASQSLLLGVLAVSALASVFQSDIPSALHSDYVVKNFVFFACGVWLGTIKERLGMPSWHWAAVGVVAFVVAQYGFHVTLGLTHEDRGVASLLLAVVSILAVSSLCLWLARTPTRWMLALGTASMGIYVMHILAGSGARILLSRVLGIEAAWAHLLVGVLVGILLPMLALWLFERLKIPGVLAAPRWLALEGLARRWRGAV
ncbi:MAG: acyltransferase [Sphingobacteriia bacterium]|nr:acyltransferase [Sphingobacteriia bacterium]NCC40516.1 acyltransferase [Gammaproteobacteria bacterium]